MVLDTYFNESALGSLGTPFFFFFFFFHYSNPSDNQIEGEQHIQHQFSQSIDHNEFEMNENKQNKI